MKKKIYIVCTNDRYFVLIVSKTVKQYNVVSLKHSPASIETFSPSARQANYVPTVRE